MPDPNMQSEQINIAMNDGSTQIQQTNSEQNQSNQEGTVLQQQQLRQIKDMDILVLKAVEG